MRSIQHTVQFDNLKISCLDSVSKNLLSNFFAENISKFKGLSITTNIFELIKSFNSYQSNVVIMDSCFRKDLKNNFKEAKLYSEPFYVVYGLENKQLAVKKNTELTIRDISSFGWILNPPYCPIHQTLVATLKSKRITRPQIIEIGQTESITKFIRNSEFITIQPYSQAIKQVEQNADYLRMKKIDVELTRSISIFTRTESELKAITNRISLDKKALMI